MNQQTQYIEAVLPTALGPDTLTLSLLNCHDSCHDIVMSGNGWEFGIVTSLREGF